MNPRRPGRFEIDVPKLVRQIVIDVSLLRWTAVNGGRALAVISAIVGARHEATNIEVKILDFLERHVGDQPEEPDNSPPDAA